MQLNVLFYFQWPFPGKCIKVHCRWHSEAAKSRRVSESRKFLKGHRFYCNSFPSFFFFFLLWNCSIKLIAVSKWFVIDSFIQLGSPDPIICHCNWNHFTIKITWENYTSLLRVIIPVMGDLSRGCQKLETS